jgi:hypothetical protein
VLDFDDEEEDEQPEEEPGEHTERMCHLISPTPLCCFDCLHGFVVFRILL